MSISSGQSGAYWFFKGARGIASLPAIILMSAFVGFCGFAVEAGIPLGETVFMTGMIWALPAKVLLLVGTLSMSASAYLLMFASSACFEDFALTDSIDDVLCLGCPRAAIKPRGFLALALLAVGAVGMAAFKRWAAGQLKRQASGDAAML